MPPKSPLPQRNGLDPAWLCTAALSRGSTPQWATLQAWLTERLSMHFDVPAAVAEGRFVLEDGRAVTATDPYRPHVFVWFHRELRDEPRVPGEIVVLHQDERIVVVDKPPFLATIPRGRHIVESVVVRLRAALDLPELTPVHRLDRVTSGLLLLTTERQWRGPYQTMFQHGGVSKRYRAIAKLREDLELPTTVRNHLRKEHGVMRAEQVDGLPPNSESVVELVRELSESERPDAYPYFANAAAAGGHGVGRSLADLAEAPRAAAPTLAEYQLTPVTGKTHQLRMHLASLDIPIVGDPLYPVERAVTIDDFTVPLQLLANELRFIDPVDGRERGFMSERRLPLSHSL